MKWFATTLMTLTLTAAAHADVKSLKEKVELRLKELHAQGYSTTEITSPDVQRAFAETPLVIVRFRQYPIGFMPPEPLKVNNLFYEQKGALSKMSTIEELKAFFFAKLPPVRSESGAREALRAWLALAEELETDGFFRFKEIASEIAPALESLIVSGGADVLPNNGDKGQIRARLTFDRAGKLRAIDHQAKLLAGMRPICQATKLLDADPVVRRMAEQDLLTLGRDAKGYLDFIRPTLSPALQGAVDRIWKRIVAEGR